MTGTTTVTRLAALVAALTLVVGACSSDGGTRVASLSDTSEPSVVADDGADATDDGATDDEAILAFAACMREQGIDDFEDPEIGSDGSVSFGLRDPGTAGDADRETLRAAMAACRDHLDGLALGPGALDRTEVEDQLYEFAACMRDHGYDMPDPDLATTPGQVGGGPFGELDRDDPDFQSALESCEDLFGGNAARGGPGRTQGTSG